MYTSPKRRSNYSPFRTKRSFVPDKPIFNLLSNLKFTDKISENEKEESKDSSPLLLKSKIFVKNVI